MSAHGRSECLGGEEDDDDEAVAAEGDDPEEEEEDPEEVGDHRVLRRELAPEGVDDVLELLREVVQLAGTCRGTSNG